LVVADSETRFQITETPRGLGVLASGLCSISAAVAASRRRWLSPGAFFRLPKPAAAGIVGSIAPPGSVVETATTLARQIAANPPLSVQATVRARRWFMDQAERAAVAITDPMKLYLTEDFREALAAHLDKA